MKQLTILLIILPAVVFSQDVVDDSYSSWSSVILDFTISKKIYVKNEVHFRKTNFLKDWQQFLVRPSVHYKLNERIDFSAGYSFAKNFHPSHNINENNVWEQVQLSHASGKSKFKHRFRFEQRYIDHIVQNTNATFSKEGTDFTMRFRYRFTWGMPLIKIKENKNISVTAFDEIWLNTNSGIAPRSLNQNWFYAGLSYPIFKNASLGMGYMNDFAPLGTNHFRNHHILQTTLKYHINKQ